MTIEYAIQQIREADWAHVEDEDELREILLALQFEGRRTALRGIDEARQKLQAWLDEAGDWDTHQKWMGQSYWPMPVEYIEAVVRLLASLEDQP